MDDPVFMEPDLKTLRLATPELDARRLERFIAYQRAFVAEAKNGGAEHLARAYQVALAACDLDSKQVARIAPVVADFAGRRWSLRQLLKRQAALHARKRAEGGLSARDEALQQKLPKEIARAGDTTALANRYGRAVVELLLSREDELVALHEGMAAVQRAG